MHLQAKKRERLSATTALRGSQSCPPFSGVLVASGAVRQEFSVVSAPQPGAVLQHPQLTDTLTHIPAVLWDQALATGGLLSPQLHPNTPFLMLEGMLELLRGPSHPVLFLSSRSLLCLESAPPPHSDPPPATYPTRLIPS